jgi:nucleotide-binding universal stress UspA family protein
MISLKNILVPTDFSDMSLQAMRYARSFAETYEARLNLLHVVDEASMYWMAMGPNSIPMGPSSDELVEIAEKEMEKFIGEHLADVADVGRKVVLGRPFAEIVKFAREEEIDLIVLCTHGRGGLQHVLLGSVTEKVVRKAPCPVLTVRDPDHDFIMP